ncbi:MAG: uncharacterized protein QOJ65_22, partial [Fimbriimonadaceae bacterium]|nr:uncharacterized protein [Fimbriimonadaceae bacterium]
MHFTANDPLGFALLVLVGAVAAAINAVAGGGTLVSFPVLTIPFAIPSRIANATNSVGLWPGSLSGAVGFLNVFKQTAKQLKLLVLPTLLGSTLGALLLIYTKQRTFDQIVPVLILLATVILAFQPKIKKWVSSEHGKLPRWTGVVLQFLVAIYGGYFGAGMGIMMLATMALTVEGTVHELNSLKNWLAMVINIACTVIFLYERLVLWLPALA